MTKDQQEFLRLCVIEQEKYKDIAVKLNVQNATLTQWYEELKEERLAIADIRNLYSRKGISSSISFPEFYNWYISPERKCHYCEITESQIKFMLESGRLYTKRLATRGRKLELDRKQPDLKYDNLENLVLSCYWCNNAKTDTFTEDEFKKVGLVFKEIWKERLEK